MPFDSLPTKDDLADIDTKQPLSVRSIKRIVRATRAAGLLALDHPGELGAIVSIDDCPYFTPHGAVDAFLGVERRGGCPCNVQGEAQPYLERLNNAHRIALFYRAVAASGPYAGPNPEYFVAEFERLLS